MRNFVDDSTSRVMKSGNADVEAELSSGHVFTPPHRPHLPPLAGASVSPLYALPHNYRPCPEWHIFHNLVAT